MSCATFPACCATADPSGAPADCRLEANYGHQQRVAMIPLMMEHGYRPTGWLGLILGTSVWYRFDPEAVQTDEAFALQMDAAVREIGDRGRPRRVPEGVPPAPMRPPAPAPAPARALTSSSHGSSGSGRLAPAERSFTPTMSSSQLQGDSLNSSAVVELLERQQSLLLELRDEAKADQAKAQAKMELAQTELREEMEARLAPKEAISAERLKALEARLEALHAAQLLTDEELFSLEDCLADYLELKATYSVVTTEMLHANAEAVKLLKLIVLSEGLAKDAAFARQARRKFM